VLLLQLGEASEPIRVVHGGYAGWYERAWEGSITVFDGRGGAPAPDPRGLAGIIISGSPQSLVEPEPWMDVAGELIERAHEAGTPVLGVCFGHQLIGRVFGGRVVENPRGWEIGTHEVELTDAGAADPLFTGLPRRLKVNLTHRDMVELETLPAGIRVLAGNTRTPIQAVAVGEHIRGIQFHPEVSGAVCRGYLESRRHLLGADDAEALLAAASDCPDGLVMMRNFRRLFVEKS
jgi:GMP synthase (glutamine-hydrolysing)